jgi:gamma-glutamylcyclotransferase (GGCT)/AIG2-like uncharacterized protein YtfP
MTDIDSVFVYGTLKRGECRETYWPVSPQSVVDAWVFGTLFGRSDYPAIAKGDSRVRGERWIFQRNQVADVLRVLDWVEGTSGNAPDDLYHRHSVQVFDLHGELLGRSYSYFFNGDPLHAGFVEVREIGGFSSWHGSFRPTR